MVMQCHEWMGQLPEHVMPAGPTKCSPAPPAPRMRYRRVPQQKKMSHHNVLLCCVKAKTETNEQANMKSIQVARYSYRYIQSLSNEFWTRTGKCPASRSCLNFWCTSWNSPQLYRTHLWLWGWYSILLYRSSSQVYQIIAKQWIKRAFIATRGEHVYFEG